MILYTLYFQFITNPRCRVSKALESTLLSTHADRQGLDMSFTVCLSVCLFVRLRVSLPKIELAASNFARRFIVVRGRESPIFVNFAPP